jgi:deoxyribose-phosphate aldolase
VGGRTFHHTIREPGTVTAPSDRVAKILAIPDTHAWSGSVPAWLGDGSRRGIGAFIDHTLLKAEATPDEIDHAAQQAREFGTATVCVNGRWVGRVRKALEGSGVGTCAVIGFPLGAMATPVKADEARQAIADGAGELDMVMSLGEAKAGNWDLVGRDIAAVIAAAGKVPVKVILETALLSPAEIVEASLVAMDAGAAFVKTSSGFHGAGGAMEPAVRLMRRTVGEAFGVKASGGVRTAEMAIRLLAAGANRLGCSATADMAAIIGPGAPTLTELFATLPDPAPAPPGY